MRRARADTLSEPTASLGLRAGVPSGNHPVSCGAPLH